jgi:hypothetical protein
MGGGKVLKHINKKGTNRVDKILFYSLEFGAPLPFRVL